MRRARATSIRWGTLLVGLAAVAASVAVRSIHVSSADAAGTAPTATIGIGDLTFRGAFRLSSATFGESSTNYAWGAIAHNPANDSLFVAGYAPDSAIAEFDIPASLGTSARVADLPEVATPRQDFVTLLDEAPTGNPDGLDRINGLFVDEGQLIVNAEEWYDAAGDARDTTLVADADDLDRAVSGFFEMTGRVHAGGYMSPVPPEWQGRLGGPVVTGWASNSSIISRHSVGPTLFTFAPNGLEARDATMGPTIATERFLDYPFDGQRYLGGPDVLTTRRGSAPAIWNHLATAVYAFIVPGTSTYLVVGHIGGIDSGIGYKITQDDGNLCGGYCSYAADDEHNAYWLYDLNDILAADQPHLAVPYDFGTWDVPYDGDGEHAILGGAFDPVSSSLYLTLDAAGQVATYDRPPLVVVFDVADRASVGGPAIDGPAEVGQRARRIGN